MADVKIFSKHGKPHLPRNVQLLADSGYVGLGNQILTPYNRSMSNVFSIQGELSDGDSKNFNQLLHFYRARIEHLNSRIHRFGMILCWIKSPRLLDHAMRVTVHLESFYIQKQLAADAQHLYKRRPTE